jgi:GNAT superfamily N-acetyltransferase
VNPEHEVSIHPLRGDPEEVAELQRVLEEAPTYAQRVTGSPPGSAAAQSLLTALPDGVPSENKLVFGIHLGQEMVGCADLILGYPDGHTAFLGLLLVSERHQRRGVGRQAYHLLERFVSRRGDYHRIRLGVVRTNAEVIPFWTGLGFEPTGETRHYRFGNVVSEIVLLEKRLAASPPRGTSTPSRSTPAESRQQDRHG